MHEAKSAQDNQCIIIYAFLINLCRNGAILICHTRVLLFMIVMVQTIQKRVAIEVEEMDNGCHTTPIDLQSVGALCMQIIIIVFIF